MKNEYTTQDIITALEIPRERLKWWIKDSFIKPTKPAKGQGKKAIYDIRDVYGVSLFRELVDRGFKRNVASEFVEEFTNWTDIESVKFIVFRFEPNINNKKEEVLNHVIVLEGFETLDLINGTPYFHDEIPEDAQLEFHLGFKANKSWRQMIIINFKDLRERTYSALAAL